MLSPESFVPNTVFSLLLKIPTQFKSMTWYFIAMLLSYFHALGNCLRILTFNKLLQCCNFVDDIIVIACRTYMCVLYCVK
jgi:hypothetical protein